MAFLESMMKVIQDTHLLALKNDRRVGALKAELEVLISAQPVAVASSDVTEVKGQRVTSDPEFTQNIENLVADLKSELTNVKITVKTESDAARTQLSQINNAIREVAKETSAMKASVDKGFSGISSLKAGKDAQADGITSPEGMTTPSIKDLTSSIDKMQTEISEMKDTAADTDVSVSDMTERIRRLTLLSSSQLTKVHKELAKIKKTSIKVLKRQHNRLKNLFQSLEKEQEDKLGRLSNRLTSQSQSVIDQIVSESQLTRDFLSLTKRGDPRSIQNMMKFREKYTFYFSVKNLTDWWGTDDSQFSRVWYMYQANTHIKARAWFGRDLIDGSDCVCISLLPGRHAANIGLETIKATKTYVLTQLMDYGLYGEHRADSVDISRFMDAMSRAGYDVAEEDTYKDEYGAWKNNGINYGVLGPLKEWTIDEEDIPWHVDSWQYYGHGLLCGIIRRSTLEEMGLGDDFTLRFDISTSLEFFNWLKK